MPRSFIIHTDGSCLGNPGAGGWACHISGHGADIELTGHDAMTTNNRMELLAMTTALQWLSDNATRGETALIRTDSRYVMDGLNSWVTGWKRNDWRKADGGPVLNSEMWREADRVRMQLHEQGINVKLEWVRGHNGDPGNERVDVLARSAASGTPAAPSAPGKPAAPLGPIGLRPMSEARKDGSCWLLVFRGDLETIIGHAEASKFNGLRAVMHHPGIASDGFDPGWQYSAPIGQGGWRDEAFAGLIPVAGLGTM